MQNLGKMETLFQGTSGTLYETDPEWLEIVTNFSWKETVSVSSLTEKERMLYQAMAYWRIGRVYEFPFGAGWL